MSNRDFQVTSRSFAIPVTEKEYNVIDHCERNWDEDNVGQMLEKLDGVYNVDYNRHFGLYIFVSIEKEYDNDKTLLAISEIINREGSKPIYEIWGTDDAGLLTTSDKVQDLKDDGLIEEDAALILDFVAGTWEEACTVYDTTMKDLRE